MFFGGDRRRFYFCHAKQRGKAAKSGGAARGERVFHVSPPGDRNKKGKKPLRFVFAVQPSSAPVFAFDYFAPARTQKFLLCLSAITSFCWFGNKQLVLLYTTAAAAAWLGRKSPCTELCRVDEGDIYWV